MPIPSNIIEDLVSGKEDVINGFLINLNKAIIRQLAHDEKVILDEARVVLGKVTSFAQSYLLERFKGERF